MRERTYLLALGLCSFEESELVRNYVTTSADFSSWWNHLPSFYMLETALDAETLSGRIHDLAPGARFLLTPVDVADVQGWLPEISWKWLEKRALGHAQHIARL